ncbi:MAG TPA: hypothetical protein VFN18_06895 [Solirubrobacterales bacterium]|nr:hypothetical protein [Solirubrobacterales bacterium]
MKNAKAKVATGATVVLLGGLTGLALSQGSSTPSKQVADKPIVHTKVIRRTVHVTKHAKPKHPPAGAPVEPAAAGSASGGAYIATGSSGAGESESAPVYTGSSGSGSGSETAPVSTGSSGGGSESAPVATATSGAGGGGGEVESEDVSGGGGEHEGGGDD